MVSDQDCLGVWHRYTFVQGTMGHTGYSFFGDRFNLTVTKDMVLKNEIVGYAVRVVLCIELDSGSDSVLDKFGRCELGELFTTCRSPKSNRE
ncbi:hypothetical protein RSAG8_01864, partial [Rhizoctonia solani AG-8 WAC10335]